jgi:pyruvate kinase
VRAVFDCKTKLVATLGPSSSDYETIKRFAIEGLDLARINMSHGTYDEHSQKIEIIEKLQNEGYLIAIMTDLKGPKIRCGTFENNGVEFKTGDITRIVKDDVLGNKERFTTTYKGLYDDLSVGDKFTFDDGMLLFEVVNKETENEVLVCKALNNHFLKSKKGLNAPNVKLLNEYISDADVRDIDYICTKNVNYVAASFVRRKEDLIELKNMLVERGREDIKIVAKIESPEGVNNIDEILEISNAVMVARGDLGVEVALEDVPSFRNKL